MSDLAAVPPLWDDDSRGRHTWPPRGACPACGSSVVTHVVIGMPGPGEMERAPSWVSFAGCVVQSEEDRFCESCGHAWLAREPDEAES
jgi:rRNA maturation endonuclease Nob1